jgi:glycosyltransferase involved in cell wall biosynthesis
VPPDDPGALAEAIVRALDARDRLGAAGLARARREFSVERMARRHLALYESLS